ncbi:MAG: hypothetical protein LBD51_09305 [Bifidobacteriaceae bacterium]|nr:hypothetical protein [Bifidobacteriaceae bacterium]
MVEVGLGVVGVGLAGLLVDADFLEEDLVGEAFDGRLGVLVEGVGLVEQVEAEVDVGAFGRVVVAGFGDLVVDDAELVF